MQEMFLKEDHPLALNLSFSISLGLLPVTLSLRTAGCGLKGSALPDEQSDGVDHSSKLTSLCFYIFEINPVLKLNDLNIIAIYDNAF